MKSLRELKAYLVIKKNEEGKIIQLRGGLPQGLSLRYTNMSRLDVCFLLGSLWAGFVAGRIKNHRRANPTITDTELQDKINAYVLKYKEGFAHMLKKLDDGKGTAYDFWFPDF